MPLTYSNHSGFGFWLQSYGRILKRYFRDSNLHFFLCFGKSICAGVYSRQMLFYIPLLGEDDHWFSVFVGDFCVVSQF